MNTHEDLNASVSPQASQVAFRASQEDIIRQEIQKVADTATPEDFKLAEKLTAKNSTYTTAIFTITPGAAALVWLHHNTHNRDFRPGRAYEYARRMRDGEWKQNNATFGFYKDGDVEDCQHRLAAMALSGMTLTVVCVFGIDRDAIATIDDGAARHASDAVQLEGILDPNRKQAVIKAAASYLKRNGGGAAALHSQVQIADEIRKNDELLTQAIALGDASSVGVNAPYLKPAQANTLAYILLISGWPEDLVKKNLLHMQTGASSTGNESEPRFQGMNYITKARASKARADRISGIKELGILVFTIVEAQKGIKAVNKAKILAAVKTTGALPDPHFPAAADVSVAEAAE
jgi:hypothetical protein